jgi:hypothetical protein
MPFPEELLALEARAGAPVARFPVSVAARSAHAR